MSSIISPLVAAPALQAQLNSLYQNLNPTEPTPLTAFLSSSTNMQGMQMVAQNTAPGNGKVRKVQLIYTPRILESQVSSTLTTDCTSNNEPAQSSHEYQIDTDTGFQYSETFNIRDLSIAIQDNADYVGTRIRAGLDVIRRSMETEFTTALATQVGKFATTDDTADSTRTFKSVKTQYSDGKFNEDLLSQVYFSSRQASFASKPFIFGTGISERYFQALKAPASTQWGLDLAKYVDNEYVFLPSYRIGSAFNRVSGGTTYERFVALDVNNFFILQYNKFEGMVGLNTLDASNAGFVQDILIDPLTGLKFNYKWVYSPCGEKASVFISTAAQLASVPNDMYTSGDRLYQVKGSLVFEINN
jgi:hypothetical protein